MPIKGNTLIIDIDYEPLDKQKAFHQSDAKYRLYIGAWRAGKTYAGCWEAYKQSFLYKKNCGVIFRRDFTDLRDTTMKTFFEIVPSEDIVSYNKSEHHVVLRNGSEIYFKYLKEGVKLGSLNLGWFFIDEAEQVSEEIFTYLHGRLSLKNASCRGWMVSNPPNTDHWLYKRFVQEKVDGYEVFFASTYDNAKYLPADYISSLEKLPESWKKKYLYGSFGFTPDGTPFYSGFKETYHAQDFSSYAPDRIIRGWDYGWHHPACVLTTFDAKGRWVILKEIMGDKTTIETFGEYVKLKCKEWYPDCKDYVDYGDPAGTQKSDKSEKTSAEVLSSMGIFVSSKASTYRERKEIIERKLSTLIEGVPAIVVDKDCKIIIDGFLGGYHYPVRKQGQSFNSSVVEVPYKDSFYEHLMNAIEYIAVNNFTGAETKEDNKTSDYKVVGSLGDVRYMDEDDAEHSSLYSRAAGGAR